ncbi:MAG: lipopolysaccharide transport system permease protein, partial [Acidobacteriota bacterium]|nr:lipopolysaccharide transport system permease protein [Acidobacteriota bacterium]
VFYAVPKEGLFRTLVEWNPVTPLLGLARDLAALGTSANWTAALWMTLVTAAALPLAWFFYRLALPVVLEKTQ